MSSDSAFVGPLPLSGSKSISLTSHFYNNQLSKQKRIYSVSYRNRPHVSPTTENRSKEIRASISEYVEFALIDKFYDKDISRVTKSFNSAMLGKALERDVGLPTHQKAASFIEGLHAQPFCEDFTGELGWVTYLEENAAIITDELKQVTSQKDLETKGNNIWAPPVVEAANAYGPDWRTLVLQDRNWDRINTKLFPKTTKILRNSEVPIPSVEAFFARQSPETGIKLHTDDCNFILTMHLGLQVPPEKAWIEVGGERRYWESGKGLVFNTSFFHQTMNESKDEDRLVLLIRFWHPELSDIEREAFSYLFELIENAGTHPAILRAEKELKRSSRRRTSSRRGFG